MTMVDERPPVAGDAPAGEGDQFDDAVAQVRRLLGQVNAGLDTLEAELPPSG
jgi:hypothetical protein